LLTHLTDILTTLITNLYVSTGLLGIVLAMAIESCCIPLPSELVMPLAGIMIVNGKLLHGTNTLVALLLVALAGAAGPYPEGRADPARAGGAGGGHPRHSEPCGMERRAARDPDGKGAFRRR